MKTNFITVIFLVFISSTVLSSKMLKKTSMKKGLENKDYFEVIFAGSPKGNTNPIWCLTSLDESATITLQPHSLQNHNDPRCNFLFHRIEPISFSLVKGYLMLHYIYVKKGDGKSWALIPRANGTIGIGNITSSFNLHNNSNKFIWGLYEQQTVGNIQQSVITHWNSNNLCVNSWGGIKLGNTIGLYKCPVKGQWGQGDVFFD